jgi:hypothetical protein
MDPRIEAHARKLFAAGVAGDSTSHGAENNLSKIGLLVEGDPNNTYGMEGLMRGVGFEEAYEAVSGGSATRPTPRGPRAGAA